MARAQSGAVPVPACPCAPPGHGPRSTSRHRVRGISAPCHAPRAPKKGTACTRNGAPCLMRSKSKALGPRPPCVLEPGNNTAQGGHREQAVGVRAGHIAGLSWCMDGKSSSLHERHPQPAPCARRPHQWPLGLANGLSLICFSARKQPHQGKGTGMSCRWGTVASRMPRVAWVSSARGGPHPSPPPPSEDLGLHPSTLNSSRAPHPTAQRR